MPQRYTRRRSLPLVGRPSNSEPRFRMIRHHKLSVVIPCFNEEHGIREVLNRVPREVDEVVVADNNSTDRTADVARRFGAVVVPATVRGYGAALKAGLAAATGDIVITLDGDASYPPEEIPRLVIDLLERDWDFLSACRFPLANPKAMNVTNQVGNWVLTCATQVLFFRTVKDSQSGMWVFHRKLLATMKLTSDGMAFSEEIKLEVLRHHHRFGEIHIPYGERVGEVKLQKWRDGFQNLLFLVRKRFGLV
jgi:glycosyltransferase involved in cell wall biosynthesis